MSFEQKLISKLDQYKNESLSEQIFERIKTILLHNLVIGKWGENSRYYKTLANVYDKDRWLDKLFLKGMALSAEANEDFYGANHFGPLIISNALVFGENAKASGEDLLKSIAVGFGLGVTLSDELSGNTVSRGFRGTPLFGILAAALTSSFIAKQTAEEILSALAHAYSNSFGVGISLVEGTDEWRYQAGLGSYHAGLSSYLSGKQIKGIKTPITGVKGFAEVFTGNPNVKFDEERFDSAILKVGVKRYPVHIFVLSPVQAALELMKDNDFNPEKAASTIKVRVPPNQLFPLNKNKGPYERINEGISSIPTNVALTLLNGYYDSTLLKNANDIRVIRLAEKVEVIPTTKLKDYQTEIELEVGLETYKANVYNPEELYFPTFEKELELLKLEARRRGENVDTIYLFAKEIENLENRSSIVSLVNLL